MIVHAVLFRLKADLPERERAGMVGALVAASQEIPSVRRARVGTRVTHGRGYESQVEVDYTHLALLEFENVDGLRAYLEHPTHAALATRFFSGLETALVYDYEVVEAADLAGGPPLAGT